MAKVLVTGASGFLGSHLASALAGQGRHVRALVRRTSSIARLCEPNIEIFYGDMKNEDSLQKAVDQVDTVYHAAAAISGSLREFEESTIRGTRWLLNLSSAAGVRRFVLISSIVVYRDRSCRGKAFIDENCPKEQNPKRIGPYAHSKIEAEKAAFESLQKGLPVVVVRPGIIYGPGGRLIHPSVGHFLTKRWFVMIGPGDGLLPLIYIDNAVDGILLAASGEKALGQTYNLVDDIAITKMKYLNTYRKNRTEPLHVLRLPLSLILAAALLAEPLKRMGVVNYDSTITDIVKQYTGVRIDAAKARRELAWKSRVGFEEGFQRSFNQQKPVEKDRGIL